MEYTNMATISPGEITAGAVGVAIGAGVGAIAGYAVGKRKTKRRKKRSSVSRRKRISKNKRKYRRYSPHTAGKRRDTSRRRIRYTKNGQPYILVKGGKARFISKRSAKSSHRRKGGKY